MARAGVDGTASEQDIRPDLGGAQQWRIRPAAKEHQDEHLLGTHLDGRHQPSHTLPAQ